MTMTPERLAELDAVMARATANEWAAKMWDSPYKIGIWAKDGADYKTCTPIATGRAKSPDKRLLDELHLIAYEREQVPIVEANIAAIVALHNAYPDLRAHIDAQDATIARLRAEVERLNGRALVLEAHLTEAIERVEKGDLDDRMCCDGHMCGCQGSTNADQFLHFARAALTGAA